MIDKDLGYKTSCTVIKIISGKTSKTREIGTQNLLYFRHAPVVIENDQVSQCTVSSSTMLIVDIRESYRVH